MLGNECFVCLEPGAGLHCDHPDCPKTYHQQCVLHLGCMTQYLERKRSFSTPWLCPWHSCSKCGASAQFWCRHCPRAVCSQHKGGLRDTPTLGMICGEHSEELDFLREIWTDDRLLELLPSPSHSEEQVSVWRGAQYLQSLTSYDEDTVPVSSSPRHQESTSASPVSPPGPVAHGGTQPSPPPTDQENNLVLEISKTKLFTPKNEVLSKIFTKQDARSKTESKQTVANCRQELSQSPPCHQSLLRLPRETKVTLVSSSKSQPSPSPHRHLLSPLLNSRTVQCWRCYECGHLAICLPSSPTLLAHWRQRHPHLPLSSLRYCDLSSPRPHTLQDLFPHRLPCTEPGCHHIFPSTSHQQATRELWQHIQTNHSPGQQYVVFPQQLLQSTPKQMARSSLPPTGHFSPSSLLSKHETSPPQDFPQPDGFSLTGFQCLVEDCQCQTSAPQTMFAHAAKVHGRLPLQLLNARHQASGRVLPYTSLFPHVLQCAVPGCLKFCGRAKNRLEEAIRKLELHWERDHKRTGSFKYHDIGTGQREEGQRPKELVQDSPSKKIKTEKEGEEVNKNQVTEELVHQLEIQSPKSNSAVMKPKPPSSDGPRKSQRCGHDVVGEDKKTNIEGEMQEKPQVPIVVAKFTPNCQVSFRQKGFNGPFRCLR